MPLLTWIGMRFMTRRKIAFSVAAVTMLLGLAGCGSGGEVETAGGPPPERSGEKPKPVSGGAAVPEAVKKKYSPPMSPAAVERGKSLAVGRSGAERRPETEPRIRD